MAEPEAMRRSRGSRCLAIIALLTCVTGGTSRGDALVRLEYRCLPGERPIGRSEVVLWFAQFTPEQRWSGIKALLATADNLDDATRAVGHFLYEQRAILR